MILLYSSPLSPSLLLPHPSIPFLRIEQAKQHFDSALGALREGGESGLHPRHAMVLAGETLHGSLSLCARYGAVQLDEVMISK